MVIVSIVVIERISFGGRFFFFIKRGKWRMRGVKDVAQSFDEFNNSIESFNNYWVKISEKFQKN